jgi:CheY-like chemotaxis protein
VGLFFAALHCEIKNLYLLFNRVIFFSSLVTTISRCKQTIASVAKILLDCFTTQLAAAIWAVLDDNYSEVTMSDGKNLKDHSDQKIPTYHGTGKSAIAAEQAQNIKRILLVEDDMTYRTLLQTILRKASYQCVICINGESAINKLESEQFDLMILDYILPGRNASEIIRWARSRNIQTPAMILTGYPSSELDALCSEFANVRLMNKVEITLSDLPEIITKAYQL